MDSIMLQETELLSVYYTKEPYNNHAHVSLVNCLLFIANNCPISLLLQKLQAHDMSMLFIGSLVSANIV